MATASQGSLTLDLSGLERALAKASRITDQGMRDMQQRIEEAGKKAAAALSAQAASALQVTSGSFTDFQKSYDPAADAAEKFIQKNNQLALLLKQNKSSQDSFTQSLADGGKALGSYSDDFDKLRNAGALAASQVGMGTRQAALAKELAGYDEQYALARKALDAKYPNGDQEPTYADKLGIRFPGGGADGQGPTDEGGDSYAKQLDNLKTKHDQMTLQVQNNYAAMTEAQEGWLNGATSAWDDYVDKSGNVAAKSKEVFTRAFESMGDALSNFATTGKFSFSDFAKSVLSDMAKLAAQTAMSKGLSSLFGIVSSAVGSLFSSSAPTPSTYSVGNASYTFDPNLGTSGMGSYTPPAAFANGGAFTNTIATGPTLAPMALFGEAGPEAIMPLSRGADGSLGVRALDGGSTGSTSSNQVVIQQTINVGDAQGSNGGGEMNTQAVAQAYAGAARQGAAEQIARDLKPGGQIWSAINGR